MGGQPGASAQSPPWFLIKESRAAPSGRRLARPDHNRFPYGSLIIIEPNAKAFRVSRHPLPMPVEGKGNSVVYAQGREDAPTHQQAHLAGRKARFREGNNAVVMIDEGIHPVAYQGIWTVSG